MAVNATDSFLCIIFSHSLCVIPICVKAICAVLLCARPCAYVCVCAGTASDAPKCMCNLRFRW